MANAVWNQHNLGHEVRAVEVARADSPLLPFVFPVVSLIVSQPWAIGAATLVPPMALFREVKRHPARRSRRAVRVKLHEWALKEAEDWQQMTTISVMATDQRKAAAQAITTLRILRLYQRVRYPFVNLHYQAFGLPGELFTVQRRAVRLGTSPTVHWSRLGNLGTWTFSDADQDQLPHDQRIAHLLRAIGVPASRRLALDRRLLLGLELLDIAWLSHDSRIQTLHLAMALEVILGSGSEGGETLHIARRAAYLTCPAHCGRQGVSACRYLYPFTDRVQVNTFIEDRLAASLPALCSAFLDVAMDLFGDRNRVAHSGAFGISESAISQHHSTVETILLALLEWTSTHPGLKFRSLQSEISATLQPGSPYWRN